MNGSNKGVEMNSTKYAEVNEWKRQIDFMWGNEIDPKEFVEIIEKTMLKYNVYARSLALNDITIAYRPEWIKTFNALEESERRAYCIRIIQKLFADYSDIGNLSTMSKERRVPIIESRRVARSLFETELKPFDEMTIEDFRLMYEQAKKNHLNKRFQNEFTRNSKFVVGEV